MTPSDPSPEVQRQARPEYLSPADALILLVMALGLFVAASALANSLNAPPWLLDTYATHPTTHPKGM